MAGFMIPPNMQDYYRVDASGSPVGATTQPAVPNPPQATGKGPTATGKGSLGGAAGMPLPGYSQGRPGDPGFFQQDPMASRGVQSMGLAQPFYMANVSDLAQPQMAGQASYMRQMAGLGQTPMAQAPTMTPMPPAQFPPTPPPATFGGMPPPSQPVATGKGPGGPATGKMPQSNVAAMPGTAPGATGKMPSNTQGNYLPPQTPETETFRPAVQPPMDDYYIPEPATAPPSGSGAMQPEGPVAPKQAGGSMYGFDARDVQAAQNDSIRRAIDAAVQVGSKS